MDLGEHPLGAVGRWVLLCQTTLAHLKQLAVARSGVRLHWSSASGKWALHSVAPLLSSLHWCMFLERWKAVFSRCIWVPPKCWGKLRQMSTHHVCLCGVLLESKASFFFLLRGHFLSDEWKSCLEFPESCIITAILHLGAICFCFPAIWLIEFSWAVSDPAGMLLALKGKFRKKINPWNLIRWCQSLLLAEQTIAWNSCS